MKKILNYARSMRKNSTKQESVLWSILRNRQFENLKFRRQYPIGNYIADFVCLEKNLIIEIDGGQHNTPDNIVYDRQRSEYLKSLGYKVVRFWNNDINENIDGVYQKLLELIK